MPAELEPFLSDEEKRDAQIYDEVINLIDGMQPHMSMLQDQLSDDTGAPEGSLRKVKEYAEITTVNPAGEQCSIFISTPQHRDQKDEQPRAYIGVEIGDEVVTAKLVRDKESGKIVMKNYSEEDEEDNNESSSKFQRIYEAIVLRKPAKN